MSKILVWYVWPIVFISLLILCSCARPQDEFKPSLFIKGQILTSSKGEASTFVFNNELYTMVSTMTSWNSSNAGTVEILKEGLVISRLETSFSLASPIVHNGTLSIIGSRNWDKESNSFYLVSTTDLKKWSREQEIISSDKGTIFYNNSVVKIEDSFVMSYEFCTNGSVCFGIGFKESKDLVNWIDIGSRFEPRIYVACPSLKYANGMFYLFYGAQLDKPPACETRVSRSKDLISWESSITVLTPLDRFNPKSICDSDLDFTEFNGRLEAVYLEGNQKTWFNLRQAHFNGTFQDFINKLNFK